MPDENPFAEIRRVFHEPNRLALMSAILGADRGLSFGELKSACGLTDGNLSRHLRALEDLRVIRISKSFVDRKPRTVVFVTARGRERFLRYLEALESVLKTAQAATAENPGTSARSPEPGRAGKGLSFPAAAEGAG